LDNFQRTFRFKRKEWFAAKQVSRISLAASRALSCSWFYRDGFGCRSVLDCHKQLHSRNRSFDAKRAASSIISEVRAGIVSYRSNPYFLRLGVSSQKKEKELSTALGRVGANLGLPEMRNYLASMKMLIMESVFLRCAMSNKSLHLTF